MTSVPNAPSRWYALDGLRALAALVVVAGHYSVPGFEYGGDIGVAVFFVLSGFLITSILLSTHRDTGTIGLRSFYGRRLRRLYPALILVLVGATAYALWLATPDDAIATMRGVPLAATYTSNWWLAFRLPELAALDHTWTLAVEEQFYLLWPLCLLLVLRSRYRDHLARVLVIAIGAVMVWRVVLLVITRSYPRIYYGFDTRADELMVGCLLAVLLSAGTVPRWLASRHRTWTMPACLAVLALLMVVGIPFLHFGGVTGFNAFMPVGGYTVIGVLAAVVIGGLVVGGPSWMHRILEHRLLVALGTISYGIYLWHFPVRYAFPIDFSSPMAQLLSTVRDVALTIGMAVASYELIERRFLRPRTTLPMQVATDEDARPNESAHLPAEP